MPGQRTPADPGDMKTNLTDVSARKAGVQDYPTATQPDGQFRHREAPPENAYRERATEPKA
ncbi:MAG TPA: hypothetical protein VNT01_13325 [Symbiobacteriaceae bacterium]|nr:hypothetical protein [Symbiobacteriaceae bacterium]